MLVLVAPSSVTDGAELDAKKGFLGLKLSPVLPIDDSVVETVEVKNGLAVEEEVVEVADLQGSVAVFHELATTFDFQGDVDQGL